MSWERKVTESGKLLLEFNLSRNGPKLDQHEIRLFSWNSSCSLPLNSSDQWDLAEQSPYLKLFWKIHALRNYFSLSRWKLERKRLQDVNRKVHFSSAQIFWPSFLRKILLRNILRDYLNVISFVIISISFVCRLIGNSASLQKVSPINYWLMAERRKMGATKCYIVVEFVANFISQHSPQTTEGCPVVVHTVKDLWSKF